MQTKPARRSYGRTIVVLAAVLIIAGTIVFLSTRMAGPSQSSQSLTAAVSKVQDPKGDGGGKPSYLDIVSGQVSLRGSSEIVFEVTVSGQIPPKPTSYLAYGWFLTSGVSADRAIALAYDDKAGSWDAFILNTTGKPVPTVLSKGLSFAFNGNSAQVTVPLNLLGTPNQFTWHVLSRDSPFGDRIRFVDRAPDDKDALWQSR